MNCNVRTIARFMFFACAMSLTGTRGLRSQAPETIKEALAKAGVKRDSSSLIDALGNPKPLIRGLAAMELADQYNTKAIPAIEHALSNETDAIQRLNMAAALNLLGDPFGTSALVAICDDSLLSDDLRLEAAERTLDIKNIRCAQAVKAILAKSEMPSLQSQALIYLTDARLPPNTVATSDTLFESGLRRALHSMDAETRRKSALCVGKFMISAMKKDIAAAILIEHDSSVKDALVLTQKQLSEK